MTPAHDTSAALEAAIDKYTATAIVNAIALGAPAHAAAVAAWAVVESAITAHVEAEVARRLAAAPPGSRRRSSATTTTPTGAGTAMEAAKFRPIGRMSRATITPSAPPSPRTRRTGGRGRIDRRDRRSSGCGAS